jgi:hypothetical protein
MRGAIGVLAVVVAATASAQEPPPKPKFRVALANVLGGRINPLGLEEQLHLGPAMELYQAPSRFLRDNFLYVGLAPKVSPSRLRLGGEVELQAVSFLNLRVVGELVSYLNVFGQLQSFPSPLDTFSDSALSAGQNLGRSYRTTGAHVAFQPTMFLKLGPVALVDRLSVDYWSMNVRTGDTVFYEGSTDTLVSHNGWVLTNDVDLVYLTKVRLAVGARYTVIQPFYSPDDFRPGEPTNSNPNGLQRLGPLLAYTVFEKPRMRVRNLTVVLVVGWYLEHRWRTGADTPAGLPMGSLALLFYSDFVPR